MMNGMSLDDLDSFIAILYLRGASRANTLPVSSLWSEACGLESLKGTVTRDRYKDIMRYVRFDLKSERAVHLQTDTFALAS